ncbi:MAG: serine hydrolase domain-containing protein [Bacillota bacterium]
MVMTIAERMERHNVHGLSLAVIQGGRLARAEGYGLLEGGTERGTEPHHLFHACSISKTVTAMTTLSLAQDGLISLDTDIRPWSGSLPLPSEPVTLRHLLSHQSGLVDAEGGARVAFAPGARFEYADAGYAAVEQALTAVTGQPFGRLVEERVLQPLGMAQSTFAPGEDAACGHDRQGRVIPGRRPVSPCQASCGLWSSAPDLAQVALELMAALQGRGRVLSQRTALEMTTPPWHPRIGLGIFLDADRAAEPWHYHYGWGTGFQGALSFSPGLQSGLVILMNADPGVPQWRSLVGEVAGQIATEMGWPRTPTPALW